MPDDSQVPSADAVETELESPRLRFYRRHKAEIETWAALKTEVREATSDLLLGLRDDLETRTCELGAGVLVRTDGVDTGTREALHHCGIVLS